MREIVKTYQREGESQFIHTINETYISSSLLILDEEISEEGVERDSMKEEVANS